MLRHLQTVLESLARGAAVACGYGLLVLSLAICLEIVLRQTFRISLQGIDEMGGYVLAIVSAFGFALALADRAHTRVDLMLRKVPTLVQAALNILSALLFAAIASFMAWRAFAATSRSYSIDSISTTPLQTPIWIPQALWFAGLALFACLAIVLALRGLLLARVGREAVNQLLGAPSLANEIEEVQARISAEDGGGEGPR